MRRMRNRWFESTSLHRRVTCEPNLKTTSTFGAAWFIQGARPHLWALTTLPELSGCFWAASSCYHQRSIEFSAPASARSTAGMSGRYHNSKPVSPE